MKLFETRKVIDDYEGLKSKAISEESTAEDRVNLFLWFEQYDYADWNSKCFNADEFDLYPIYQIDYDKAEETEEFILIDAEIKWH